MHSSRDEAPQTRAASSLFSARLLYSVHIPGKSLHDIIDIGFHLRRSAAIDIMQECR